MQRTDFLDIHQIDNLAPEILFLLDTTKSDREAIRILKTKHQILYVFYHALFNFYTSKIFSTLFFDFIDLIFRPYFDFIDLIDFKKIKN